MRRALAPVLVPILAPLVLFIFILVAHLALILLVFQKRRELRYKDRKEFKCGRTVASWDIRVMNGINVGVGLFTSVGAFMVEEGT